MTDQILSELKSDLEDIIEQYSDSSLMVDQSDSYIQPTIAVIETRSGLKIENSETGILLELGLKKSIIDGIEDFKFVILKHRNEQLTELHLFNEVSDRWIKKFLENFYKRSDNFSKNIDDDIDEKYGESTHPFSDGGKYIGVSKDGKKNGQGTYFFSGGGKYVGSWKDDKKDGHGAYFFSNGSRYVGSWKDDKKDGQGTYTDGNGNKIVGKWMHDLLVTRNNPEPINSQIISKETRSPTKKQLGRLSQTQAQEKQMWVHKKVLDGIKSHKDAKKAKSAKKKTRFANFKHGKISRFLKKAFTIDTGHSNDPTAKAEQVKREKKELTRKLKDELWFIENNKLNRHHNVSAKKEVSTEVTFLTCPRCQGTGGINEGCPACGGKGFN